MPELESKFNPGYEYLNDSQLKSLQLCLDVYVSGRTKKEMADARKKFPRMLREAVEACSGSEERILLLIQFLRLNIKMNYAGGIGKDINNPVIAAISRANAGLAKKYPNLF
jgi:hypothetical protein